MASVEEICDDIALINHSEVVLKGDMRQIKEAHRTCLLYTSLWQEVGIFVKKTSQ